MERNRSNFLLLIFLMVAGKWAFAQTPAQTVRGTVVDAESRQPLIGANVIVTTTDPVMGAATDVDGYFRIEKVPVGRHDLKVTYLGYEELIIPQVLVGSGKEVVLNIDLVESVEQMEEVVVKGDESQGDALNEMATVSARSITVEQTDRFPATADDPSRLALSFAGVNLRSDISNEIVIRGNSPSGLLWRVEGVEIPSPNHLTEEGNSAGSISMLSNNVLGTSDFYTGAFPAEYGNALSGVFDLNLKNGNNEKREYAIQVGTLGMDASLEGPFSSKSRASYLINYRYSTLSLIDATGYDIPGDLRIGFQDVNFKVHVPAGKAGIFSLWGVGGTSTSTIEDEEIWGPNAKVFITDNIYGYNMGATGLTHTYFFNERTWLKTTTSVSGYNSLWKYGYYDTNNEKVPLYRSDIINKFWRNNMELNTKLNAKNTIRAGGIFSRMFYQNKYTEFQPEEELHREDGNTSFSQMYAQWKHRINDDLTLISGLHSTYFHLNQHKTLEPRLGFTWELNPANVINIGAGLHSRMETLGEYMVTYKHKGEYGRNDHLELAKAVHLVLGYTKYFTENLRLKVETYYQHLYDVPIKPGHKGYYSVLNDEEGYSHAPLTNDGQGRNFGLELTCEKFFSHNWYLLSTASLFQSEYLTYDNVWRSTKYNGNFITNLTVGKDFNVGSDESNVIGINGRVLWAGGRRYQPIDFEASALLNDKVEIDSAGYTARAENYFRIDIGIRYKKNKSGYAWSISADVQNATNRLNEAHRNYDPITNTTEKVSYLGILPVLKFRVEF